MFARYNSIIIVVKEKPCIVDDLFKLQIFSALTALLSLLLSSLWT